MNSETYGPARPAAASAEAGATAAAAIAAAAGPVPATHDGADADLDAGAGAGAGAADAIADDPAAARAAPFFPPRDRLTTASGAWFEVRAARPLDQPALQAFLARLTLDDLRFRFLSPIRRPPDLLVRQLLRVDHRRTEHLLVFAPHGCEILASAVIAIDAGHVAEIAICTRPDWQGHGISWALLDYATGWAARHGGTTAIVLEAIDHDDAIRLEREQGFRADPHPAAPGVVRLVKFLD